MKDPDKDLTTETRMRIRVLKCRETGETGAADVLNYNRATGRIELVEASGGGEQFPDDIAEEL